MADPTNSAPLAAPWWTSSVQVNAVIAALAQIVSIALRVVSRYTDVGVSDEDIQLLVADITQAAAIVFGILAIVKRQKSDIQPLTMSTKAAEAKIHEIQVKTGVGP
jgi:tetrahydromethanopterin S-methyltransferase subunit H